MRAADAKTQRTWRIGESVRRATRVHVFHFDADILSTFDFEVEAFRRCAGRTASEFSGEFGGDVFVARAACSFSEGLVAVIIAGICRSDSNDAARALWLIWRRRFGRAIGQAAVGFLQ